MVVLELFMRWDTPTLKLFYPSLFFSFF
jgi:hypothetical protein